MKSIVLLVLPALCSLLLTQAWAKGTVCSEPNTALSNCSNSCLEKCPTYPPRACPKNCKKGCFCSDGYSRTADRAADGTCIPTGDCPVKCPDDQVFDQRCTDSCSQDRVRCSRTIYGCHCKFGLQRINGKCEPESKCYNCSVNEEYNACGNPCFQRCPGLPTLVCPAYCTKGCVCKRNFYRSSKTGLCIPVAQCAEEVKCPEHSTYGCGCDDSCNENIRCIQCLYSCYCDEGYHRIDGKCQPKSLCNGSSP